jgi:hypothetical protein
LPHRLQRRAAAAADCSAATNPFSRSGFSNSK